MKVYLDICCFNRPLDDPTQPHIASEAGAVEQLLIRIDQGRIEFYSSEMANIKISSVRQSDRRRKISSLLPDKAHIIYLNETILDKAQESANKGFMVADAIHLASANELNKVFLSPRMTNYCDGRCV